MESFRIILTCFILVFPEYVSGHGRLTEPPSRASMFRFGFDNPPDYSDNQLFCGGVGVQYSPAVGGRCGICGDPFNGERQHEAGGRYANGIIVRQYEMGTTVNLKIQLTANHKGWTEFKICPNNDVTRPATQECFDQNLLQRADGQGSRFEVIEGMLGDLTFAVVLPASMTCAQCIVQWRYHAGNSWGTDPDGTSCIGCGNQEEFYGCADVAIVVGDIVQVTDPVQDATLPPGNDPNMDDYVDWEWDTEPTSTAVKVIPTTSFLFLLMCSFLYFLH